MEIMEIDHHLDTVTYPVVAVVDQSPISLIMGMSPEAYPNVELLSSERSSWVEGILFQGEDAPRRYKQKLGLTEELGPNTYYRLIVYAICLDTL